MTYLVIDVEADSASPATGSMISFGAVVLSRELKNTFFGQTHPICGSYDAKNYELLKISREEHLRYESPKAVMSRFKTWILDHTEGSVVMFSDNPAFDWQWINFYFHKYLGVNPLGYSARRIGDLYCGLVKDVTKNQEWKSKFRKTPHTHHPVDDAMGNAEALLAMSDMFGLGLV